MNEEVPSHSWDCPVGSRVVEGDRRCCQCKPCGKQDCPTRSGAWDLVLDTRPVGGHRYFVRSGRGHDASFAIVDDSGANPDECEDGILWLRTRMPLCVGKGGQISIPIEADNGQRYSEPASVGEMLMVSQKFGMMIKVMTTEGDSQQFTPAKSH